MKLKYLIIGLIVGVILASTIGVFAEGIVILRNPYPISVNGQVATIEAYNIDGRTFLALGDVAKYFNATAKLNEVTKEIEISTNIDGVSLMTTTTTMPEISEELRNTHPNIQWYAIIDNSPSNFTIRDSKWLKFVCTGENYSNFELKQQTLGYGHDGFFYLQDANNNFIPFKRQRIIEGSN